MSVIVAFRNPGSYFEPLLESLVNQELTEAAEIVAVDNGSTDGSGSVARAIEGPLPLTVVDANERANASYACNVGVRVARGDKLLFVDADDQVAPGYLAAMAGALDSHEFVTSRVDSSALNPEWVQAAHGAHWQTDRVMTFFDFMPAAGVNVGLRRKLLEDVGGWPEDFSTSQDIVLSWRILLTGRQLHFVEDAVYLYRYRDTLADLFRQSRSWGISSVLLYRSFRESGMPGRTVGTAVREWSVVAKDLLRARSRSDLAPVVVNFGRCVGRLIGSVRYRRWYL